MGLDNLSGMCYNTGVVSNKTLKQTLRKKGNKMANRVEKIIREHPIFAGISEGVLTKYIYLRGELCTFEPGEQMMDFAQKDCGIGVLTSGRGVIFSADPHKDKLMRFVSPGEIVGVASLFTSTEIVTRLSACGDIPSKIFIIPRSAIRELLDYDTTGALRNNLLTFLADRITFLNGRIACVTGGSAERRLAMFIRSSPQSGGMVHLGMSMKSLAVALDIGRASLYRAVDSLESEGIIRRMGSAIMILEPERLSEVCR